MCNVFQALLCVSISLTTTKKMNQKKNQHTFWAQFTSTLFKIQWTTATKKNWNTMLSTWKYATVYLPIAYLKEFVHNIRSLRFTYYKMIHISTFMVLHVHKLYIRDVITATTIYHRLSDYIRKTKWIYEMGFFHHFRRFFIFRIHFSFVLRCIKMPS